MRASGGGAEGFGRVNKHRGTHETPWDAVRELHPHPNLWGPIATPPPSPLLHPGINSTPPPANPPQESHRVRCQPLPGLSPGGSPQRSPAMAAGCPVALLQPRRETESFN